MTKVKLTVPSPRLTFVFHPNRERVDVTLNDRFFNKEEFMWSRKKPATGNEERLLKRLGNLPGIKDAKTAKQELDLELIVGIEPADFCANVVALIKEYAGEDYNPEICVQDRRWAVEPVYDRGDDYGPSTPGVRETEIDIGMEFTRIPY